MQLAQRLSLLIAHDPGGPLFHAIPMDAALDPDQYKAGRDVIFRRLDDLEF